jgi:hypothetical protein
MLRREMLLRLQKDCNTQIYTDRPLSIKDRSTIANLFHINLHSSIAYGTKPASKSDTGQPMDTPGQQTSKASNDHNKEHRQKASRSSNSKQSSRSTEAMRDDEIALVADTQSPKEAEDEDFPKFLYICFPNSKSRSIRPWKTDALSGNPSDQALIQEIKRTYTSLRPAWKRLMELRGFSTIRLAKVSASIPAANSAPD